MNKTLAVAALALPALWMAACSPPPAPVESVVASAVPLAPMKVDAPAGVYTVDKMHASLIFRVSHMGFSMYTARFSKFDITLNFDPENPAASTVEAKIDPRSLGLENPPAGFQDDLIGPQWLDAKNYPAITFKSTSVELTGPDTARVTGDFTLHGVTKPVVLDAKFNGGYPGMMLDPHARIGLSARGVFKRSEFGMGYGVPAPGTNMGVGDNVDVQIEAEFNGPAWTPPSTAPSTAP